MRPSRDQRPKPPPALAASTARFLAAIECLEHLIGSRSELLIGRGTVLGECHATQEFRDDLLALCGREFVQGGEEGLGATGHDFRFLLPLPPVMVLPRRGPWSG